MRHVSTNKKARALYHDLRDLKRNPDSAKGRKCLKRQAARLARHEGRKMCKDLY